MSGSLIDKVAMAIAGEVDEGTFYKAPAFQAAARAAIAAMREPTEGMREQGRRQTDFAEECFTTMIDAALNESEGE